MIPKSFVFISIHSYNQKTTPIHSYIFPPKKSSIHSYIFQFMRIYSKKNHFPIHSYIFQFSRIYSKNKCTSNSFVYIPIHSYTFPKKNTPNSFVFFNSFGYIPKRNCCPIHSYVFQFIRVYFQKTIHSGRPHRSCKGNQKRRFKRIGNQTLKRKAEEAKLLVVV